MKTPTMKKAFLSLVLILSCSLIYAQENEVVPTYKNEWGLNITAFAQQFLSFNENQANEGSFLFTYKRINGVKAFRLGAGLFFNHTKTEAENNSGPLNSDIFNISLRLGHEKQFPIEKRWLFTAGGDFIIAYEDINSNSSSNFGEIKIKSREFSFGYGPVVGIHFRFNPRVSIGTEGTIYLRYFNSNSTTDFGGVGGGEDTEKSSGVNFAMSSPLALYFAVRL